MNIRKYTLIFTIILIIASILFIFSYQNYYSEKASREMDSKSNYDRFVSTKDKKIQIYNNGNWEDIKLKGIELSSFKPGYERYASDVNKDDILRWLEQISNLNANLIKIPSIQPPSFYNAIYEHNLNSSNPIYIMHEIGLDEKSILKYYDINNEEISKKLKTDIKNTIDVVHGKAIILNNPRNHRGIYLKDVSSYNIGYIIGKNTNQEIISLSNIKNTDTNKYSGEYYKLEKGNPFEAFVAETFDFLTKYEIDKYNRLSLISYLITTETDLVFYRHDLNMNKYGNIDIQNIEPILENNLFASYKYHPNSVDFSDYEYETYNDKDSDYSETMFYKQLKTINKFYDIPVIIADTGISSSRGISKIDIHDGFHRGGFTQKQQGENIVKLLKSIDQSGCAGSIIKEWQDNWTNLTSFSLIDDYLDENASSYWFDYQSSDESFGLMSFELGDKEEKILIDGNIKDWENKDFLIKEDGIKLKVHNDTSYIYMLIERKDLELMKDKLYIGIDITPFSGSKYWDEKGIEFSLPADFIVKFNGYMDSQILVNDRYDLFSYLYKYYSNSVGKQDTIPKKDSGIFSPIYLLNREKKQFKDTENPVPAKYYETGKLVHGSNNPTDENHNSLTDFNKKDDVIEIRLPLTLLNIKNPFKKEIYGDFYEEGIESQIKIEDIGLSIYLKQNGTETITKEQRFELKKVKELEYYEILKESYYIIKDYWNQNEYRSIEVKK